VLMRCSDHTYEMRAARRAFDDAEQTLLRMHDKSWRTKR
jgi:hypothetical protein